MGDLSVGESGDAGTIVGLGGSGKAEHTLGR